jgi:hypothetical protein
MIGNNNFNKDVIENNNFDQNIKPQIQILNNTNHVLLKWS